MVKFQSRLQKKNPKVLLLENRGLYLFIFLNAIFNHLKNVKQHNFKRLFLVEIAMCLQTTLICIKWRETFRRLLQNGVPVHKIFLSHRPVSLQSTDVANTPSWIMYPSSQWTCKLSLKSPVMLTTSECSTFSAEQLISIKHYLIIWWINSSFKIIICDAIKSETSDSILFSTKCKSYLIIW